MQQPRSSGFICGLVAIGLLTAVVILTAPAQAASGNGPYYATPSWDQKLPASTRFVVLTDWNNEAVLDRNTGLVWEKSPDATGRVWAIAKFVGLAKNVGGLMGWRLPAIAELTSLIDPMVGSPGPTLPAGHPFTNIQSSFGSSYWSVSTVADDPTFAWAVDFNFPRVINGPKDNIFFVWCVRGGSNADTY